MLNASYHTLRRLLGQLGIVLPLTLYVINGFHIESSISHFYYTPAGTVFTGILITFGLFLFTYKGHPINSTSTKEWFSDNLLTNIAGVLAVITALIPTAFGPNFESECVHVLCHNNDLWGLIHLACAAGFLGIMGGVAIFKFTLGPCEGVNVWRHPLYRICGYIVWGSLVAMGVYLVLENQGSMTFKNGIFFGETVALVAFGIAWLVKGDASQMLGVRAVKRWMGSSPLDGQESVGKNSDEAI